MKKDYSEIRMEIIEFDAEDVIETSPPGYDQYETNKKRIIEEDDNIPG